MKIKQLFMLSLVLLASSSGKAAETSAVMKTSIDSKVIISGHVEAINESTVSAQVNAKVKKINVDVDDRVAAGTILLELDDTELKAQLAKATAALEVAQAQQQQANSEYKRLLALKGDSFVSENDMTKAKSAVDVAKANVNLTKAQISEVNQLLTYTVIVAPYSGVVTARHIEVGETANFGQPLLTGFALNQNRLKVHIPNSLIDSVESAGSLLVKNDQGQWQTLTNLTIAPSADPLTHTVMVRANIDKSQFSQRPGSFIDVAVKVDNREALTVPASSVFYQGDLSAVYVQKADKIVLRQVMVGENYDDRIEVITGLSENETVITNGAQHLASVK